MTLATIKTVVTRFLKNDEAQVIAIKGAWGVGKTYAWQQLIKENKDTIKLQAYSYVSLFGITSITQLRTAIFAKSTPTKMIGQRIDFDFLNNNWDSIFKKKFKDIVHFGSRIFGGSLQGKSVTVGLETIAPFLINNTIICLDDFERLPQNGINVEELLGFICELREEKNCKVVLIFNEAQLNNTEIYSKYREKVIDIEVLYDPTPLEAMELSVPSNLPLIEFVKAHCKTLEIKNIRVLKKIVSLINDLYPKIETLHPKLQYQTVHTGVLLSWSYFENGENIPTIAFLREWNRIAYLMNKKKNDGAEVNSAWIKTLNNYEITDIDEFDETILNVIERGYIEETGFIEAAEKLNKKFIADDLDQSFSNAWKLYHNSFSNNEEEIASALISSLKNSVSQVNLMNLSGTTMLLRYMGKDTEANSLIEYYANAWVAEKRNLDLKGFPFTQDIKDPMIWKIFEAKAEEIEKIIPLSEIYSSIIDNSLTKAERKSLCKATADDFYNVFNQDHGENLSQLINRCLEFLDHPEPYQAIGKNTRAALIRIGRESRINTRRVERFGITNDELN